MPFMAFSRRSAKYRGVLNTLFTAIAHTEIHEELFKWHLAYVVFIEVHVKSTGWFLAKRKQRHFNVNSCSHHDMSRFAGFSVVVVSTLGPKRDQQYYVFRGVSNTAPSVCAFMQNFQCSQLRSSFVVRIACTYQWWGVRPWGPRSFHYG